MKTSSKFWFKCPNVPQLEKSTQKFKEIALISGIKGQGDPRGPSAVDERCRTLRILLGKQLCVKDAHTDPPLPTGHAADWSHLQGTGPGFSGVQKKSKATSNKLALDVTVPGKKQLCGYSFDFFNRTSK